MQISLKPTLKKIPVIKILPGLLAFLGPVLIPVGHIAILWYFWQSYARFVDKRFCSCSCWDTVFKATYESGIASYKNFYFNATTNTLQIWLIIVIGILSLYECLKYLINLMIRKKIRYSMGFLFMLSIFSHYYGWWAFLNYLNDEFYSQWFHQMFFTITELFSSSVVLHLTSTNNQVTSKKVLCIVGISILHIWCSSVDQFISNVFRGEGYPHQVVRDICFMVPDLMHFIIPIWLLNQENINSRPFYRDRTFRRDICIMMSTVAVLFFICSLL